MDKYKQLISYLGEERVKLGENLSYHTFSKTGGPADLFYIATSQKELISSLDCAFDLEIPYFLLGSGTKALILHSGINGLVIKNRTSQLKIGGIKGKVGKGGIGIEEALVEVDSGVSLGKLNEFLKEQSLQEIVGLSSLHSTIGGSIFLDPTLVDLVQKIRIWDSGEVSDIKIDELKRSRHVVIAVVLKIKAAL